MAKLKPIKDEKELAAVPLDEPVLVELEPAATGVADAEPELKVQADEPEDGPTNLAKQLKASEAAVRTERERRIEAERAAQDARTENDRLKSAGADTEKELLSNSLAGAQAEEAAAKAAFKTAFEAGDADAMAEAQSKIGRAAARVLNFEGAVAQFDEDAKEPKDEPRAPQVDIITAIERDPKLMPKERDWLKEHSETLLDDKLNRKLAVGYDEAIGAGHKRGSDGYFQFLDKFMGYAKAGTDEVEDDDTEQDERSSIVAAPVSRDSRSSATGKPLASHKVLLSSEQRKMARDMGVTDAAYARGVQQLEKNKKADPERFAGR